MGCFRSHIFSCLLIITVFLSPSHIGNIHKQITALIYNILQFKYIVAEVTANGIQLGMSKKYYHHYLLG